MKLHLRKYTTFRMTQTRKTLGQQSNAIYALVEQGTDGAREHGGEIVPI